MKTHGDLFAFVEHNGYELAVRPIDPLNPGFGWHAKAEGRNFRLRTDGESFTGALDALVVAVAARLAPKMTPQEAFEAAMNARAIRGRNRDRS